MFNSPSNGFKKPNSSNFFLPSEILSHIFSFLKVRDRSNVRLTCSRWYDACNTIPILQSEKMFIPSDDITTWYDALMNCPRLRLDIEFYLTNLPPDTTVFWQKLGSRVKSLMFDCSMGINEEFTGQMIKFCNNLEKLRLDEDVLMPQEDGCVPEWDGLEIAHESLKCLAFSGCRSLTDFQFNRLFDIYPCIQELELIYTPVGTKFSLSCLLSNIRLKAENIKRLVFSNIGSHHNLDNWYGELASLPGLKLKELELSGFSQLTEKAFIEFFTHQTHLEYIKINECDHFSSKCFLHMVQNCPRLKTIDVLTVRSSYDFLTCKEIFHALMLLPSLKTLSWAGMSCTETIVNVNQLAPVSATAFQCLQALTLTMPAIYFDMYSPTVSSNLSVLNIDAQSGTSGLTDVNLQVIFDKWIHLRSLKVNLHSTVSDFGFTGCRIESSENPSENSGISISRLKKLKKLVLVFDDGAENSITPASFCHFVFPNLRKLKLTGFPKITAESLKLLSQNSPSMNYCELVRCEVENKALRKQEGWKSRCYFERYYAGYRVRCNRIVDDSQCCLSKFYQRCDAATLSG